MGLALAQVTNGLHVDGAFLLNSANWIDNEDTYRLYYNCHHALQGFSHRDWHNVGQASYALSAVPYFRLISRLKAVKAIYDRVPSMIELLSKAVECRVIESAPGHVRLRYAMPVREIAMHYTIGAECWYHLGGLSALPKLQSEGNSFAATNHELCSMPAGHILVHCYDVRQPDYEYTDKGLVVFGKLLGRWVRLEPDEAAEDIFTRDYSISSRRSANALLIVRELDIGGAHAFLPGEIYDAPHCLFDVRYEPRPILRRLAGLLIPAARYRAEQVRNAERLVIELDKLRHQKRRLTQMLRSIAGDPIIVASGRFQADREQPSVLTHRESEVAERVALGMTNGDIADELFISTETVKRHMHNIFAKLGVTNRVQLVRRLEGGVS